MRLFIPILIFVFLNSGCVLKSKHDEIVAREIKCEQDSKKLGSDLDQLNQKIEEAKRKLSDTESRNEELSQTNQLLVNKNSEFTKKTTNNQEELLAYKAEKTKAEQKTAQVKQTYDDLFKGFGSELENQTLEIHQDENEIVISIQDVNLFSLNSNDITAAGLKLTEKVTSQLKKVKAKQLAIECFSEAPHVKSRKGAKHNASSNSWEASTIRAAKLAYAFEKSGFSSNSLRAIGRGESSSTKKKNGEVEITVSF